MGISGKFLLNLAVAWCACCNCAYGRCLCSCRACGNTWLQAVLELCAARFWCQLQAADVWMMLTWSARLLFCTDDSQLSSFPHNRLLHLLWQSRLVSMELFQPYLRKPFFCSPIDIIWGFHGNVLKEGLWYLKQVKNLINSMCAPNTHDGGVHCLICYSTLY